MIFAFFAGNRRVQDCNFVLATAVRHLVLVSNSTDNFHENFVWAAKRIRQVFAVLKRNREAS